MTRFLFLAGAAGFQSSWLFFGHGTLRFNCTGWSRMVMD